MITAGIDVGSISTSAVILRGKEIISYTLINTGPDSAESSVNAIKKALLNVGMTINDIEHIAVTGYGRIVCPVAKINISEISCHAIGANWLFPAARTILDMGGQDCKAIRCNHVGKVNDFILNDTCAAGTGRGIEQIVHLLKIPIDEAGERSLNIKNEPININNTCVIFAKSEILNLIREGFQRNDILAGYFEGVARRVVSLLKKVGIKEKLIITGGIAKNPGVVKRIEKILNIEALIPFEPQLVGALGAALHAQEKDMVKHVYQKTQSHHQIILQKEGN